MRYVGLFLVLLALLITSTAKAGIIYIRNTSTVFPQAQLVNEVKAYQDAFTYDFNPVWGTNTNIVLSQFPPARTQVLTIVNEANAPGALGYHDVARGAIPFGVVMAKTIQDSKGSVSATITHELFEMAVDPLVNDAVKVSNYYYPFYLQETADPVEADKNDYGRVGVNGSTVLLSDFVTPNWFRAGSPGPWDFTKQIQRPLQILPGGYQIAWNRMANRFTRICAPNEYCRRK